MAVLEKASKWLRGTAVALLVLIAIPPIGFGIECLRYVVPEGWPSPPPGTFLIAGYCWLLVTITAVVMLFAEVIRERRIGRLAGLVGLAAILLGTFPILWRLDQTAKRHGLSRVRDHAQPIVRALAEYESGNKAYPDSLEMLVPQYLAEVPNTGLAAHREFSYARRSNEDGKLTFDLWVDTPQMLDFDSMHYLNDPEEQAEYISEVVGEWGFFDD